MIRCIALVASLFIVGTASAAEPLKVLQRWALLIGVDDYAYAQKLQYCGADQRALAKQLIASGFPQDQVFLLDDKADDARMRPSQGNIERHLGLILNLADADDLVVIAFSGHGVNLDGKSFLCPGDCTLDDPKSLVSVDALYEQLKNCNARFKLVLVDACRNDPRPGGARSMTATDGTRALARTLQDLRPPEGVVLLNSCAPGEVSWEDEKFGHGVFMHFVLDALKGSGDANGDGAVSLTELQSYAGGRTKTYVANLHRVVQRPFFRGDLSTEALEYALLPVAVTASLPLPPAMPPPTTPPKPPVVDPRDTRLPPWPTVRTNQPWIGESRWQANQRDVVLCGVLRDGPAGKAGLKADDTILSVGGRKVTTNTNFYEAIEAHRPGDVVDFEIERNGSRMTVPVTLEPIPPDGGNGRIMAAAEAGESWAMMDLGVRYAGMRGNWSYFEKNDAEAVRWFRRSMEAGLASGPYFLGLMYQGGRGVGQDLAQAVALFEQSRAARGDGFRKGLSSAATSELGNHYLQGAGVPRDVTKGLQLYREAAAAGSLGAQTQLGKMYENGQGVAQSYAKAMQEYQAAAQQGHGPAAYAFGLLIYNGRGVQKDLTKAREWFESAAAYGSADAMYALGSMNEKGEGGPRNPAKAAEWYRNAADKGHVEAKKKVQ